MYAIMFKPFCLLASKDLYIILLSNLFIVSIPDVGYYVPDVGYYVPDVGY
jgi:hypothetical protein